MNGTHPHNSYPNTYTWRYDRDKPDLAHAAHVRRMRQQESFLGQLLGLSLTVALVVVALIFFDPHIVQLLAHAKS
jgi:hypothetical protein